VPPFPLVPELPPVAGAPASPPVPPEPPGGVLQVPIVEPGGRMQVLPGQQSALMLQLPPAMMHFGSPGGISAQRKTP
jgi:hypothetical protein